MTAPVQPGTAALPPLQSARPATASLVPAMFVVTIFMSAALVFLVEPMVGKLLLPLLGGAPAVWNTALAFFQVALLLGYAYAHLLQRLPSVRLQVIFHGAVLCLAALTLPLHISQAFGEPNPAHPIVWMLGVLTLSVGGPFAALSATAPLVQAWFAKAALADPKTGKPREPYALYAASNFGSLLALVAYPALIEPLTHLTTQRLVWSLGFVAFAALIVTLGLLQKSAVPAAVMVKAETAIARPTWALMLIWIALAAAPSSLMMGVTTFITTDVASAPFLWVVPLALYLVTFILAFRATPIIKPQLLFMGQAIAICACVYLLPFGASGVAAQLTIHLFCFFMTALVCHMTLAAMRPDPSHLTLFYLCMSFGGVVGGSFNAFVAPIAFSTVVEYPLVLVLACLARPWFSGLGGTWKTALKMNRKEAIALAIGALSALTLIACTLLSGGILVNQWHILIKILLVTQVVAVFFLRDRAPLFVIVLALATYAGIGVSNTGHLIAVDRSFFGVSKITESVDPEIGPVRIMYSGTTVHGAQALTPSKMCQPLTYYAPQTGIGQTMLGLQSRSPALNIAAVGLGAGIFSSYVRPTDHLTYYEIDPTVKKLATNPAFFTYTSQCAKAPVGFVLGDARLTLSHLPQGQLDMLMVDAFSSDAVPAHLLTVESVKMYFSKLHPDGVLLFNLTNRHLELRDPVIAAIREAGGVALTQTYINPDKSTMAATRTVVVIASMSPAGLKAFKADPRWQTRDPGTTQAWTDDYTNLIGALLAHKD